MVVLNKADTADDAAAPAEAEARGALARSARSALRHASGRWG